MIYLAKYDILLFENNFLFNHQLKLIKYIYIICLDYKF